MRTKRRPTARRTRRTPSATARFLHDRYIGDDPRQQAVYEAHLGNAAIARQIYDLRMKAGLTQRALAQRVGTTASVICRLEDADYDVHSLALLRRVAAALGRRVEVRLAAAGRKLG